MAGKIKKAKIKGAQNPYPHINLMNSRPSVGARDFRLETLFNICLCAKSPNKLDLMQGALFKTGFRQSTDKPKCKQSAQKVAWLPRKTKANTQESTQQLVAAVRASYTFKVCVALVPFPFGQTCDPAQEN